MPIFGLVWVTSCLSCFFASTQALWRVPDYLHNARPARVFAAVSNPLESFYPLVTPTQLYATTNSFQTSLAFWPSFGFNAHRESNQLSSNSGKPNPQMNSSNWLGAIENALCRPATQQVPPPIVISQSASYVEVPSREIPENSLPHKISQVIQNLFRWGDWGEAVSSTPSSSVTVVRTRYQDKSTQNSVKEQPKTRRGFWLFSQLGKNSAGSKASREEDWFQVLVKGRLVTQTPDKHQAELTAKKIAALLQNPGLDASQLQPVLVDGKPAGQLGKHVLFVIDDAVATNLDVNRELLAIEWVNNLRVALGESPLTIAAAQRQMYSLVATDEKIEGLASWYGDYFQGRLTANGEKYNQYELTAAHPSLPFNTYLQVTNKANGNAVIVRVNDRGPYVPPRKLDLSRVAARCIQSEDVGVVPVEAVIMQPQ